jgi:hypothetical protein
MLMTVVCRMANSLDTSYIIHIDSVDLGPRLVRMVGSKQGSLYSNSTHIGNYILGTGLTHWRIQRIYVSDDCRFN